MSDEPCICKCLPCMPQVSLHTTELTDVLYSYVSVSVELQKHLLLGDVRRCALLIFVRLISSQVQALRGLLISRSHILHTIIPSLPSLPVQHEVHVTIASRSLSC